MEDGEKEEQWTGDVPSILKLLIQKPLLQQWRHTSPTETNTHMWVPAHTHTHSGASFTPDHDVM